MIAMALYDLSILLIHQDPMTHLSMINTFRAPIMFIATILFVVAVFQYVNRLKREKCECSEGLGRSILFIVAAINSAVFAVAGLIILAMLIAFVFRRF
jgi:hypothetical protein